MVKRARRGEGKSCRMMRASSRRTVAGVGAFSKEDAINWGLTGPVGRACGIDYDVRKDFPYSIYPELEFDVPTATTGD